MLREVELGLADDPSVLVEQANPLNYPFKKKFWPLPDTQAKVPKECVDQLLGVVRKAGIGKDAHDSALREFITRNIVAHLLIYRWYHHLVRAVRGFWTPYATRSSLLDVIDANGARALDFQINIALSRSVVSNILANTRIQGQKDFLNELKRQADAKEYQPLREKLAELADTGEQRERTKLLKAIERAERGGALQVARKFIFPVDRSLSFMFSRRLEHPTDYLTRLFQIFPQLGGHPTACPIIFLNADKDSIWTQLSQRLNYRTRPTPKDVKDFVDQFPKELHAGVIAILNSVRCYDNAEFENIFKAFAAQNGHLFENAVFASFTEGSGSDSNIKYIFEKSMGIKVYPTLARALAETKSAQTRVILLDDCVLSGKQAGGVFLEYLGLSAPSGDVTPLGGEEKEKFCQAEVVLLTALATPEGPNVVLKTRANGRDLHDYLPRLIVKGAASLGWTKLFEPQNTLFPGTVLAEAEKFFRDVGYSILEKRSLGWFNDPKMSESEREALRLERRRRNAVGYGDDQALVVFRYNVPKATVTLLWEKHGKHRGQCWKPLFPINEPD